MLFNELAQWAALIFIAVFVLGLTRQLGNFMVPVREQIATEIGPALGQRISTPILTDREQDTVRGLIEASEVGWGLIVTLHEACTGCDMLLTRLEEDGAPSGAVVVALSRDDGEAHVSRLERLADLTIIDAERLDTAELTTAPFAMLVDPELELLHKEVTPELQYTVETWLNRGRTSRDAMDIGTAGAGAENGRRPNASALRIEGGNS